MSKFWNMTAQDGIGEITMYGDISDSAVWGDEVTPKIFKQELDALGDISELHLRINSGGGDVFAGQAIYNIIKTHGARTIVHIDGLAASIASVIAMAGDEIIMPENALMMIHEAWTVCGGNKHDLIEMASTLNTIDETIRGIYTARTGLDDTTVADMMKAETWLTAAEALEKGFITCVEANKRIAASVKDGTAIVNGVEIDLHRFRAAAPIDEEEPAGDPQDSIEHSSGEASRPVDADTTAQERRAAILRLLDKIERK